jgi:hypothetical protein
MRRLAFRIGLLVLPVTVAAWAGCSSTEDTPEPGLDAGAEGAPDVTISPPADAATDAGAARDCAADLDADGLPHHLDCTGLYADFASKTLATGNAPYKPGVEFWSDGADKSRFLHLPTGTKLDISSFDDWKFPAGTKAWKEFKLEGKRIETRLYWKIDATAWRHVVYRWNADETDAVRLDTGEKIAQAGKPPYEIPATGTCIACHAGRAEPLLGVEPVSLGLSTSTGVTLASLAADGRFSQAPPATQLTLPDDGTAKAAAALGWLHANCGACHNPSTNAGAFYTGLHFLIRASDVIPDGGGAPDAKTLDGYKTAYCVSSSRVDPDGGAYKRIRGGSPSESIVSILAGSRAPDGGEPSAATQMPPLVTHAVDTAGKALLDDWIAALPPCP